MSYAYSLRGEARRPALGSASTLAPAFLDQVSAGRAALAALMGLAVAVKSSTDPQVAGIGEAAFKFASLTGPRLLNEAVTAADGKRVAAVQTATRNIVAVLKPEVLPAVISRFHAMILLGPTGALLSADALDSAKNAARDLLPGLPDVDLPWWVPASAGLAALVAVSYVVRSLR